MIEAALHNGVRDEAEVRWILAEMEVAWLVPAKDGSIWHPIAGKCEKIKKKSKKIPPPRNWDWAAHWHRREGPAPASEIAGPSYRLPGHTFWHADTHPININYSKKFKKFSKNFDQRKMHQLKILGFFIIKIKFLKNKNERNWKILSGNSLIHRFLIFTWPLILSCYIPLIMNMKQFFISWLNFSKPRRNLNK